MYGVLCVFLCVFGFVVAQNGWRFVGNPLLNAYACNGSEKVLLSFESGRPPDEENQYEVYIKETLPKYSQITIKFNTDATVSLFPVHPGNSINGVADTITGTGNNGLDRAKKTYRPSTSWSTSIGIASNNNTSGQLDRLHQQDTEASSNGDNLAGAASQDPSPTFRPTPTVIETDQNSANTFAPPNKELVPPLALQTTTQTPEDTVIETDQNSANTFAPPNKELVPPLAPQTTTQTPEDSDEFQLDVIMRKKRDPVIKFINRFDPNSPDPNETSMTTSEEPVIKFINRFDPNYPDPNETSMTTSEEPVIKFINRFDPNSPDPNETSMTTSEIINIIHHVTPPNTEYNTSSYFIPDYVFPLNKSHPGYESDDAETSFQTNSSYARISSIAGVFSVRFFKNGPPRGVGLKVKGPENGAIPYITSLDINNVEYCEHPNVGVFDNYIVGVKDTAEIHSKKPKELHPTCGVRQVTHTELITNGLPTKPGDWPWHAALYRFEGNALKYKCGGTLISKSAVLTAAHCTTIRGVPLLSDAINVVLGKYNLFGGDLGSQEREVYEIVVHENYNASILYNDISILKLKTEAVFGDYVQPACIWEPAAYDNLPSGGIFGTVVGWGFDLKDQLSLQLRQATIPKISELQCIRSHPVFFEKLLNDHNFCAGYTNGTSACNGDSGGGFVIFVPNKKGDSGPDAAGSWYIRGIVSVGVSRSGVNICDPSHYTLFTDIAKFRNWIKSHMS